MSFASGISLSRPRRSAGARLRPGDVDVWRAALDEQSVEVVQLLQTLMSADEAERARRFCFERDRRRFIVCRGILRMILGDYLGLAPKALAFTYGPNDKPALALAQAGSPPLRFNVAHSEGLALIAVTRVGEVGIDLERIRDVPEWEQIATTSFSPRELARIYAAPPERRNEEFFRAWTRQEAVLKALGVGLNGVGGRVRRRDGNALDLDESNPPASEAEQAFAVYPLNPGAGYVAALAASRGGRWTTCLTWPDREPLAQFPFRRRARRVPLQTLSRHGADFL